NRLVSGSGDETLRVWNRKTGMVKVLSGHTDWVREVDVSRNGKMVASSSDDKTVRIWNGDSGKTMHVLRGHRNVVFSVGFSPDSSRVVSGSYDHTICVWSVETGKLAFEPIKCHSWVYCVRYSPSGDRIASGGTVGGVQIWDADMGTAILSIPDSTVFSLAWTPDSTHIIGGRKAQVTIWNSHNGEPLRTWEAHNHWIRTLVLSHGTYLATCDWGDTTAFVFDYSTGKQVAALEHIGNVYGIACPPSGQLIATGCITTKLYLWEAPSFKVPQTKVRFVLVAFTPIIDHI
ncbi:WD40 repeat-like protein, partial [Paxillus ammoniavirescens]